MWPSFPHGPSAILSCRLPQRNVTHDRLPKGRLTLLRFPRCITPRRKMMTVLTLFLPAIIVCVGGGGGGGCMGRFPVGLKSTCFPLQRMSNPSRLSVSNAGSTIGAISTAGPTKCPSCMSDVYGQFAGGFPDRLTNYVWVIRRNEGAIRWLPLPVTRGVRTEDLLSTQHKDQIVM